MVFSGCKKLGVAMLAACMLLGAASAVRADFSPVIFSLSASNEAGFGTYDVAADQLTYDPVTDLWLWAQTSPVVISSNGGNPVAVLENANMALMTDPQVAMGFAVQAGASDTVFTIQSALLSFPTIPAAVAEGRASAAFTVTDQTGDGAWLTGLGDPGTGAYQAYYNGFAPTGTLFTQLIAGITAGSGGSGSGSQNFPGFGFENIPVDVDDMSAQVSFTLSAGDLGSGTSFYQIVPEPASILVLLLGIPALAARRRRPR